MVSLAAALGVRAVIHPGAMQCSRPRAPLANRAEQWQSRRPGAPRHGNMKDVDVHLYQVADILCEGTRSSSFWLCRPRGKVERNRSVLW